MIDFQHIEEQEERKEYVYGCEQTKPAGKRWYSAKEEFSLYFRQILTG
jgi:hypothetical protein